MSELKAGRELDALVAEKVMGWRPVQNGISMQIGEKDDLWEDGSRKWYGKDGDPRPMRLLPSPKFSTDIAAAWRVVAYLESRRKSEIGGIQLNRIEHLNDGWCATFNENHGRVIAYGTDYSLPFALTDGEYGSAKSEQDKAAHDPARAVPLAICRAALKAVGHDA